MSNIIQDAVEKTETEQHEKILAKKWDELGWSDELAQIKSEESDLNFIHVVYERSRLFEGEMA